METLKELLEKVVEAEKLASIDLEAWPRKTLASITNTVYEAKQNLATFKKRYFDRISGLTVGIYILGKGDEEFAKIAEAEGGTLTAHADALYARMADVVMPVIPDNKTFTITAFSKLVQALTDIGHELEVKSFDMLKYTQAQVADRSSLIAHIRNTIRTTLGDDLNRLYLAREINTAALKAGFKSSVQPVVIIGLEDADEIKGLEGAVGRFGAKFFTDTGSVGKKEVLDVFASVKERLKSSKK